ncbi:MAG TPA: radical SAM protein [Thermodesulfobacteriota bacterium]|nr:radical SAM protein [Thermodesulfobacteriota bacterium]
MARKLLIIQPSHYRSRSDLGLHKVKKRTLIGLTLPYLAALTPRDWQVTLIDEGVADIDFKASVDLVAITTWTINSFRAYEIADRFRERGVPVIMGGPHTYFYSDEAAEHCDGVGIGEGENVWRTMLEDGARGKLKKIYRADHLPDLKNLPLPRFDLLPLGHYGLIKTFSIQSSRGCPFKCEFCSERFYLGPSYRYRPVEEVIEEIKQSKARNILFADSNFAGKISHTMELMEALIPLKVRWSTLWSAYLCNNDRFMDLAKRSGLLHVNIGIESIRQETLSGLNKRINQVKEYKRILGNLRKRGISYSLNFIFGWDTEKEEVFASTLAFLKEERVPVAYFNILTPHKGTPLYERMKAENRIIDLNDIGRWPGIHCYIRPVSCSAEQLEERVKKIYSEFYSYSSIFSRLPWPLKKGDIASWLINLSERKVSRAGGAIEDFDAY